MREYQGLVKGQERLLFLQFDEQATRIQGIVYRHTQKGGVEVLVLQPEVDGGIWQMLTGGLAFGESVEGALVRELKEEAGLVKVLSVSEEIYRFSWQRQGETVLEMVYGVEVPAKAEVKLNQRYQDFWWLPVEQVAENLGYKPSRVALQAFKEIVLAVE